MHRLAGCSLSGGGYVKIQLLIRSHELGMRFRGDVEREMSIPPSVLLHFLPFPCTNFGNKSAMVRVMTNNFSNA